MFNFSTNKKAGEKEKKELSPKNTHSVRFYMMVSVLPIIVIFVCACFYLRQDLSRISRDTDIIVEQVIPSLESTQNTVRFFSELGYVVDNIVNNADAKGSRNSYLRARELIEQHYYLMQVKNDLELIKRNTDWMIIIRNNLDLTRSQMFGYWQATYIHLVDMHFRHNVPFDISQISFLNHDIMHYFHEGDQRLLNHIKKNTAPFVDFCVLNQDSLDEDSRKNCHDFLFSNQQLEDSYAKAGRLDRDLKSLLEATIRQIRDTSSIFANTEFDIISQDLSDVKQTAHFYQLIITILMVMTIALFLIQNAVVQFYIVKPLTYLTGVIHAFVVHRIVPERFYSSKVREIREIESLLPSVFTEVKRATDLNLELLKTNQNLKDISLIDDLTKIRNRRALNEFIAENTNTRASYAVLMLDIDHFKILNDTQGHLKGDEVLAKVANCLVAHTSRNDHVFRYGGEEFCVILGAISALDAVKVGDRLREAVAELKIPNEGAGANKVVTVSVGVSREKLPGEDDKRTMTSFIAQADVALYRAKSEGRNRTCLYEKVAALDETFGLVDPKGRNKRKPLT